MDVAVTRMHVQRDEHAAAQNPLVDCIGFSQNRHERVAGENAMQRRAHFDLPRGSDRVILYRVEYAGARIVGDVSLELAHQVRQPETRQLGACSGERRIEVIQQIAPALTCVCNQLTSFTQSLADNLVARQAVELGIAGLAERK